MNRLYTLSMNNRDRRVTRAAGMMMSVLIIAGMFLTWSSAAFAVEQIRDTIRMRVVAVNPSASKSKNIPIKVYLPLEVTPKEIVSASGLTVEYDDSKSLYYAFNKGVELAPKQTKIFEIEVNDVWIIPQEELNRLKQQTDFVLGRLANSEFFESAKQLVDAIHHSISVIIVTQNDETVSRKQHIGIFRNNQLIMGHIRKDIDSLERILTLASAPPVPEVLETSDLKTDSPSKTTTWMIIFIIALFLGMLAAVFFFTWHAQSKFTDDIISKARDESFPGSQGDPGAPADDGK